MAYVPARRAAAIAGLFALLAAAPASALDLVGSSAATFAWAEASGPVDGYAVYVARNGGSFPALPEVFAGVADRSATIAGLEGETIVVRVAAFDADSNLGPFSPNSEPVHFVAGSPPLDASLALSAATVTVGEPVTVTASASGASPSSEIEYLIDCTSNGNWEGVIRTTARSVTHTCSYDRTGTYAIKLLAWTPCCGNDTETNTVQVAEPPPPPAEEPLPPPPPEEEPPPAEEEPPLPDSEPAPLPPASGILYYEDFETYAEGQDPLGWFDTASGNALQEDPTLFGARVLGDGNVVLATSSTDVNIHSHWVGPGSETWSAYELAGRLQISRSSGGIGVTLFSDYPASDAYYRLRRYDGNRFHLAPHTASSDSGCAGSTDSGVMPAGGVWYRFRFQAMPDAAGTRLRARLWREGDAEPTSWPIDCVDTRVDAFHSGTVGVWSMGAGDKYWDDLRVTPLSELEPVAPQEPGSGDLGAGEILYADDFDTYPSRFDPPGWYDSAAHNSLHEEPRLFETVELEPGNGVFGTSSTSVNIHSHLELAGSEDWSAYEFRGRLRLTSRTGGIGVTLYSDYPRSDRYYRLRRYRGNSFHLAPHGEAAGAACVGTTDTGLFPRANRWYRFRFQAIPETGGTRLRAKVWRETDPEPSAWPVDCLHEGAGAYAAGTPGLWAMGRGRKYWDDLEVHRLTSGP